MRRTIILTICAVIFVGNLFLGACSPATFFEPEPTRTTAPVRQTSEVVLATADAQLEEYDHIIATSQAIQTDMVATITAP